MTEAVPFRPPVGNIFHDRPPSVSSTAGSQRSSPFPHGPLHYKVSSQNSLAPPSPRGSYHSWQRVSTVPEDVVPRPAKRLKSQYPLYGEPHVEYILVASFDIDRGPIMEHQYPGAISPDENMLAELMLPDQTHVRQQDWTMFFLHKDTGTGEDEIAEREARRQHRLERRRAADAAEANDGGDPEDLNEASSSDESDLDDVESPPLMYVLNLVNTKQDSSVKRCV